MRTTHLSAALALPVSNDKNVSEVQIMKVSYEEHK